MGFYRKTAAALGRLWDSTFGVRPSALNVPVRYEGLPDPVVPVRKRRRQRTGWEGYKAKALARRRTRNKAAAKSRAVNRG